METGKALEIVHGLATGREKQLNQAEKDALATVEDFITNNFEDYDEDKQKHYKSHADLTGEDWNEIYYALRIALKIIEAENLDEKYDGEATVIRGTLDGIVHLYEPEEPAAIVPWKNNSVQFPRLIAEAEMAGAFGDDALVNMADSMDLSISEVTELIDRAQAEWDKIKEG